MLLGIFGGFLVVVILFLLFVFFGGGVLWEGNISCYSNHQKVYYIF